jgi:AmpE protein
MAFLAVLLALGAAQLWGRHPLSAMWLGYLGLDKSPKIWTVLVIAVPSVLVGGAYYALNAGAWVLAVPFSALILWVCLGGTTLGRAMEQYINAARAEHWPDALAAYQVLGGAQQPDEMQWSALHRAMLERTAYLGFSHVFAVIFWFMLLGPAGALGYKLLCVCLELQHWPRLARLLWFIEWPAARLLGLTFAFTGNFMSCIQRWQACVFCSERSSAQIITHFVLGALGVHETANQDLDVTRREVAAMERLMRRSLWFWMGILAFNALIIW